MSVLYITLYLSLLLQGFQLFSVSTYGFGLNDACLCLLYAVVAKRLFWDGEPLSFSVNIPFTAMLGLLGAVLLSGLTPLLEGQGLTQYLKTTAHFIYVWLFAVIAAGLREPPKTFSLMMRAFVVAAGLVAAYGIYQVMARALDLPFAWVEMNNVNLSLRNAVGEEESTQQLALQFANFYRATSIFSEPSLLASFTTIALVFLGIPYLQSERLFVPSAAANWIVFLLYIGALFLTFSLTGLTGVLVICGLVFALERGRRVLRIVYGTIIIIVCLSVIDLLVAPVTKISILELFGRRIEGIIEYGSNPYGEHTSGESFVSRAESITISADIWEYYPVNGVGLGRFSQSPPAKRDNIWFSISSYSSVLAELGLVGLLVLVVFVVSMMAVVLYWYRRRHEFGPDLRRLLGVLPYFFALLLYLNLTGNIFVGSGLWQWVGMVFLITNAARREHGLPFTDVYLVRTPLREVVRRALHERHAELPDGRA